MANLCTILGSSKEKLEIILIVWKCVEMKNMKSSEDYIICRNICQYKTETEMFSTGKHLYK